MFLGYNTNGFAHHRLEDAIEILAEIGYGGIGLTLDYHHLNPKERGFPQRARQIRKLLQRHQLRVVIETGARFLLDPRRKHQPTLVSSDQNSRLIRAGLLGGANIVARILSADAVSFWSGTPSDNAPPKQLMDRLVESCNLVCLSAANKYVRLAFEPEPGMFIDTMDKFAELHERVNHPAFGLTLDVGHLQCQGELPISEHIKRWRHVLWNVHIEDMKRGVHDHLMFGEGEIDFADVFTALREIDYQGGVFVELSRHSHNAVETARKSIEFLRRFVPAG